jgi:hypothetical protein
MGDTSGAAFYSALMDTLPSILPPNTPFGGPLSSESYQTWDSRPLPVSMVDPYTLPALHLSRHLTSIFFQHCSDTLYFLSPTAFPVAVQSLYNAPVTDPSLAGTEVVWTLCQLYMVLALASIHISSPINEHRPMFEDVRRGPSLPGEEQEFPGMPYFAQANILLSAFPERASFSGAQTLALVVGA